MLVEATAFNLIKQAVIFLPRDVKNALAGAYAEETSEVAKTQLKTILTNIALAEEQQIPMCQDTGVLTFYVRAGNKVRELDRLQEAFTEAVRKATFEVPLRPNAVDPFTQKNNADNTGRLIPQVQLEITSGDCLEITVMAKGGGSENVSALGMLAPSEGVKGLMRFVIDAVVKAGAQPCPPTILGIGVGGGADVAMSLAKKSLLLPLNVTNNDPEIAQLERELLEAANMTGIGPMGLGGRTTALGVHVDYAFRHPASYPVAVAFNCWASRRASARIHADGNVEYITHQFRGKE